MADQKLTQLTELTAVDHGDLIPIVDDPAGTAETKKIKVFNFARALDAWLMQTADYTLTSQTAAQKLFNTTTNGALTLPTGVYELEVLLYLTTMSGTSGNAQFQLLGAGTATLDRIGYAVTGIDNNSPLNAGTKTGSVAVTANSAADFGTIQTNQQLSDFIKTEIHKDPARLAVAIQRVN